MGSPFDGGQNPQSVAVHPGGHLLYVMGSTDQNGEIGVFAIDSKSGAISQISGSPFPAGLSPTSIAFAKAGQLAYVPDIANNQVLGYSVDKSTGVLTALAGSPFPTGLFPNSVATDKTTPPSTLRMRV